MNDQMLGADTDQLRALAQAFGSAADQINSAVGSLSPAVQHSPWSGGDAMKFRADWNSRMRPQLNGTANALSGLSKKLVQQAADQDRTSAVDGGGPGGVPGPTPEQVKQHQADLRSQLAKMQGASKDEVEKWWNGLSDEDKKYLMQGKDSRGNALGSDLLAIQSKLPAGAVEQLRSDLTNEAKATIPVFKEKTTIGIDGRAGWVHGGAHLASEITENADGSASLKVSGDIGGGVNNPGGGNAKDENSKPGVNAGATLTGEISRTYLFKNKADAEGALNGMVNGLPPDGFGDVKKIVGNPVDYINDKLNGAAQANHSVSQSDSVKGTLSVYADGKLGGGDSGVSGGVKMDLAYEHNLSKDTSSASGTLNVKADLDLGNNLKLAGDGEVGAKITMDGDNNIQKLTISAKGNLSESFGAKSEIDGLDKGALGGFKLSGGDQGTVQMDIPYTAQNQQIITQFMGHMGTGDTAAMVGDLQQIYKGSAVTMQVNTVAKAETNLVDMDAWAASLKIGKSTEVTSNVGTLFKLAGDEKIQAFTPVGHR
ncbi:MAG: WXG100 family type VII secretion target [Renibacterium sp.]|nr:WXG100 family type VII secretion target [Renibacterium sp.]